MSRLLTISRLLTGRLVNSVLILFIVVISGCIEPIDFETGQEPPRLVVEGLISNNSYQDRQSFPGPPERFYVSLRWSRDVSNELDDVIGDASVELIASSGDVIPYNWNPENKRYENPVDDFKAIEGIKYHIKVQLSSGETYISDEEYLHFAPPISKLDTSFETRVKEIKVRNETSIVNQRGVVLSVDLPKHNDGKTYYYRWKVVPGWIFESSLLSDDNPNKTCYITNKFYFKKINVQEDRSGGYNAPLFFLETDDNEKIEHDFTALIIQYSLSPDAYSFWENVALQQQSGGGIFDPPPFPLNSNIQNINNPQEKVSGYFMVAQESVTRWFIRESELPYNITFPDPCEPIPGDEFFQPPPECGNCLRYQGGHSTITNQKPEWWRND